MYNKLEQIKNYFKKRTWNNGENVSLSRTRVLCFLYVGANEEKGKQMWWKSHEKLSEISRGR